MRRRVGVKNPCRRPRRARGCSTSGRTAHSQWSRGNRRVVRPWLALRSRRRPLAVFVAGCRPRSIGRVGATAVCAQAIGRLRRGILMGARRRPARTCQGKGVSEGVHASRWPGGGLALAAAAPPGAYSLHERRAGPLNKDPLSSPRTMQLLRRAPQVEAAHIERPGTGVPTFE